ncbi:hypothetical protein GCM10023186_17550 [Hymenobacter koreensis]|uniref:T9SS type A sorting domain-containing protein n=2 Tax=Hymenobacter koreensis TaxID=1084523 RepID=A0ABP8IY98_9BACT
MPYPKEKIGQLAKEVRSDGWVYFKEGLKAKPEEIASKHKDAFGLSARDVLKTTEVVTDELKITRFRYQQLHLGLPVEGADFSVYAKGGRATHAAGKIVPGMDQANIPRVSEAQALAAALAAVPAKRYAWQDKLQEAELKREANNPKATHYPVAQLLYALPATDPNAADTRHQLAYRFVIMRVEPSAYEAVYVDAAAGKVFRTDNLEKACNSNTVDTFYNGNHTVETHWDGSRNKFQLKDFCRGGAINTKYSGWTTDGWNAAVLIEASGSNSNPYATNWNWDFTAKACASAHWSLQRAHDYFWNTYQRNGGANDNRERRIEVDFQPLQLGASYKNWDGKDYFKVSRNPYNNNSMAELDVVAHEFTHSVTEFSAHFQYRYESGALDESFADIFALMTERFITGSLDWVVGAGAGYPRWFANLGYSIDPQAQSYLSTGAGWLYPSSFDRNDDFGWVHINSGVQNRWFYLLATGGTGNFGTVVSGIGPDKAARIAYRSLTTYLTSTATYPDARAGAIQAAQDLYGECSAEAIATIQSWRAVGVGGPAPAFCAGEIRGSTDFCLENGPYISAYYTAAASPGATKFWSSSNGNFMFDQLGVLDGVRLRQIPTYAEATSLSVEITYNGNTTTKYLTIAAQDCYPDPPYCPPGQPCELEVQPRARKSGDRAGISGQDYAVHPNPASYYLTVTLPDGEFTGMLIMTDMLGRRVATHRFAAGQRQVELKVSDLPTGTYLLSVTGAPKAPVKRIQIIR